MYTLFNCTYIHIRIYTYICIHVYTYVHMHTFRVTGLQFMLQGSGFGIRGLTISSPECTLRVLF